MLDPADLAVLCEMQWYVGLTTPRLLLYNPHRDFPGEKLYRGFVHRKRYTHSLHTYKPAHNGMNVDGTNVAIYSLDDRRT